MSRSTSLLFAVLAIVTGLAGAVAFERVYDIQMRTRPPDQLAVAPAGRDAGRLSRLRLRLVDSGGGGIPLDSWGRNYSHDRRVFRDALAPQPPYVDVAAFRRVEDDWRTYVERMIQYGNNAITVPLLLELIDFDRV